MEQHQFAFKLYGIDPSKAYTRFPRIKYKKHGIKKIRWINAPCDLLKTLQKTILTKILYRFSPHPAAHGYVSGKNILTGASIHCKKKYTIVLDIKNFFPSITAELITERLVFSSKVASAKGDTTADDYLAWDTVVTNALTQSAAFEVGFPENLRSADILVGLCTLDGCLPQGAPTSGALANIVMYPFDTLIDIVARDKQLVYTRYADDLAFSGDDLVELKKFAFGYVSSKLHTMGLEVNASKIHVFTGNHRIITGLNVHAEGCRPTRQYRRKVRAGLATLRNEITRAVDLEQVVAAIKGANFFHKPFGHLWYTGYTDTYGETFKTWVEKYFDPILQKIDSLLPGFGTFPAGKDEIKALEDKLQGLLVTSPVAAGLGPLSTTSIFGPGSFAGSSLWLGLLDVHHRFRKISSAMSFLNLIKKGEIVSPIMLHATLGNKEYHSHIKRLAVSLAMQQNPKAILDAIDNNTLSGRVVYQAVRVGSLEDKVAILKCVFGKKRFGYSYGVSRFLFTQTKRLPIAERYELLATLGKSAEFGQDSSTTSKLRIHKFLSSLLRMLSPFELAEFACCTNVTMREIASKQIVRDRPKIFIKK